MSTGGAGPHPFLLDDTNLADLDLAWKDREVETATLTAAGSTAMRVALRVYALEIRLKCRICRLLKLNVFPKVCKTHDLAEIIIFTGLWSELRDPANVKLLDNWNHLARFSKKRLNDFRYFPDAAIDPGEVAILTAALDHPTEGVLAWLNKLH